MYLWECCTQSIFWYHLSVSPKNICHHLWWNGIKLWSASKTSIEK